MAAELVVAFAGPVLGAVVGTTAFMGRRMITRTDEQLTQIGNKIEVVVGKITDLQVDLATHYVTKAEMAAHIDNEERWQNEILSNVRDLRADIRSLPPPT